MTSLTLGTEIMAAFAVAVAIAVHFLTKRTEHKPH